MNIILHVLKVLSPLACLQMRRCKKSGLKMLLYRKGICFTSSIPLSNLLDVVLYMCKNSKTIKSFIKFLNAISDDTMNYLWSNFQLLYACLVQFYLQLKLVPDFGPRPRLLVPASYPSLKPDFISNFVTKLLIGYMQMNGIMPETIQASL